MEFRDLKSQYKHLEGEINEAVGKVMADCNFINGKQVQELEGKLADYVGVKHCVTCGNGTDALTMMMMAWDIRPLDAVFVPDFTFFASGEVVSFEGATPVFYDVHKDTFNADAKSLERAIQAVLEEGRLTPRAVIGVDLFGQPADYKALKAVADKYDLLLLEDAAQGFGGSIAGQRAGSFGDAATTSFFPAKPLGCYGDGGAVFTNDDEVAEYLRSVRVHGKGTKGKYDNVRIGWNSRLDTLQAAVLQVKLKAFVEYELEAVNKVAECYTELLKDVVPTPAVPEGFYSSWAQYTIRLSDEAERTKVQEALKSAGIPTMIYYPKAMSAQQAFAGDKQYIENLKTRELCTTVLSLPMHPYLNEADIRIIADAVKRALA